MDSDNLPLLDPSFLFNDPNYIKRGNLFWPDIYCGTPKLHSALGIPYDTNVPQTESGQFVFNREKHWVVLEWLLWLNTRDEITYKLSYGDKDTFKGAFYLAERMEEFYTVEFGLGVALHQETALPVSLILYLEIVFFISEPKVYKIRYFHDIIKLMIF